MNVQYPVDKDFLYFEMTLSFTLQSTLSYIKKTSSLEAYIEWFNRLSFLVATEVCLVSNTLHVVLIC